MRPAVTIAYAQTLNGTITIRRGTQSQIGCHESDGFTHMLRGLHDGIAVGVGTVLADNPRLTCRDGSGPSPMPVVFDSHLQTPPDSRRFREHPRLVLVCSEEARKERSHLFAPRAVTYLTTVERDLDGALEALKEKCGLRSLMVEGGARLIESFLSARLFDLAVVTVALRFLGGYQIASESDLDAPLALEECFRIGEDLLILAGPGGSRHE